MFCADREGQIRKRSAGATEDTVFAKGRKSTPVWAAQTGEHAFVAFLANQKTTEGLVVRAFVALDGEVPIPLSEEGSGATSVAIVPREEDVLAVYLDARTALTPVHARVLDPRKRPPLGPDSVVLVGLGAETHIEIAAGRAESGPTYVFVPGATEDGGFGLSTVAVDAHPKDDLPSAVLKYADSMTRPQVAATVGTSPVRVAFTEPKSKEDRSQVLKIGTVGEKGDLVVRCAIKESPSFDRVAVAPGANGKLWIAYSTPEGTFVEERGDK